MFGVNKTESLKNLTFKHVRVHKKELFLVGFALLSFLWFLFFEVFFSFDQFKFILFYSFYVHT